MDSLTTDKRVVRLLTKSLWAIYLFAIFGVAGAWVRARRAGVFFFEACGSASEGWVWAWFTTRMYGVLVTCFLRHIVALVAL
jgi:hypothetical protein